MTIVGVDNETCTRCGACVEECCAGLFSLEEAADRKERVVVHRDPRGWCTGCGHCLAVCPRNAVLYEAPDRAPEPTGIRAPAELCGYETLLPFLQSKRSVRRYTAQPVQRRAIEAVIQAMRWAPTAHNAQSNRYLVITDPSVREAITDHALASIVRLKTLIRIRRLLRPMLSPRLYEVLDSSALEEGIDDMIRRCRAGQDPILFDAPVVIVVYVPDMGTLSLIDPTIAFTYGMLAAHSLGMGSCWIGFAIQSLYKDRKMRKALGIPPDMAVAGVMSLGYPLPEYVRAPPRNPPDVRWLGEDRGDRDRAVLPGRRSRRDVTANVRYVERRIARREAVRHTPTGADHRFPSEREGRFRPPSG